MNHWTAAGLCVAGAATALYATRRLLSPRAEDPVLPVGQPLRAIVLNTGERSIRASDAHGVLARLETTERKPTILVLHTLGGAVTPVVQIAEAVNTHGSVITYVPYYALSGGTLIALASKSIYMSENAVLGPVDPQIGFVSAAAILSVLDSKPIERVDDQTVALAHEARISVEETREFVSRFVPDERAVNELVAGVSSHGYPIRRERARALGLAVRDASPNASLDAFVRASIPVR